MDSFIKREKEEIFLHPQRYICTVCCHIRYLSVRADLSNDARCDLLVTHEKNKHNTFTCAWCKNKISTENIIMIKLIILISFTNCYAVLLISLIRQYYFNTHMICMKMVPTTIVTVCLFGVIVCLENEYVGKGHYIKIKYGRTDEHRQNIEMETLDSEDGFSIDKSETTTNDNYYKKFRTCNESIKSFCMGLSRLPTKVLFENDEVHGLWRERRGMLFILFFIFI